MYKKIIICSLSSVTLLWGQNSAEVGGAAAVGEQQVKELQQQASQGLLIPDANPAGPPPPPPLLLPPALPEISGDQNEFEVKQLSLQGDVAMLENYGLLAGLQALEGRTLKISEIEAQVQAARKTLLDQGLFLADIVPTFKKDGSLALLADAGRVGNLAFYTIDTPYADTTPSQRAAERAVYQGYFSAGQIDRRLDMRPGAPFNYNHLHRNMVEVNAHPDLMLNTDLKIRREEVDGVPQRLIDMDLYVKDRFPLHGIIEYKNTGTRNTEDDRLLLTLQHFNLSKRDDTLTVNVPLSAPDVEVLQAISAAYILPTGFGGVSVFGGGSRLDIPELIPNLNLEANGWFVGTRGFKRLMESDSRMFNFALGTTYREISETLDIIDSPDDDESSVAVLPITASLVFADKTPDVMRGRTYVTALSSFNAGGPLGITDEEDLRVQRPGAERDYWVQSLQLARIQGLGGSFDPRSGTHPGESYLFMNLSAQYSADPLVAAEQFVVGGLETVRGYPEREVSGDRGFFAKAELRSPVFRGLATQYFVDKQNLDEREKQPLDYYQAVAFVDYSHVDLIETETTDSDSFDLLGVGVGVRLSISKYTQFKFDYGWPLEETENSDSSGRFHFSLQAQF